MARQTAHKWGGRLDEGGLDALRVMVGPGRPTRLDAGLLEGLRVALRQDPLAYGDG